MGGAKWVGGAKFLAFSGDSKTGWRAGTRTQTWGGDAVYDVCVGRRHRKGWASPLVLKLFRVTGHSGNLFFFF